MDGRKKVTLTLTIAALSTFLLGGTAIFIALRTRYAKPPMPSKAEIGGGEECVLDFDIGKEPTPTPTPGVCDFYCVSLKTYGPSWNEIPSGETLKPPQTVNYVVKGWTDCPEGLTQARLKFESEGEDSWRYSSDPPPEEIKSQLDCNGEEYFCFLWEEIELTEVACYNAEAEVCIGDDCR